MSLLPARVPKSALQELSGLFVPQDMPVGSIVEIKIQVDDRNLNVREFGAYFSLADRVYGRMSQAGLRSYAQTNYAQLVLCNISF